MLFELRISQEIVYLLYFKHVLNQLSYKWLIIFIHQVVNMKDGIENIKVSHKFSLYNFVVIKFTVNTPKPISKIEFSWI